MEVSYLLPTPEYPDFSTPEWRARLMDWATEQEWWEEFKVFVYEYTDGEEQRWDLTGYLWRNLADLIVEYHGEGRE